MDKRDQCKMCRRAGEKLFLKGEKCNLPSCPFTRRSYGPGQHGGKAKRFMKISDYAIQLNEKQKAKAIYGISESQLSAYCDKARRVKGATGQALMDILESRLDNIVYRAAWAQSRREAKQIVSHKNVSVNGKKSKSSNLQVSKGDKVEIKGVANEIKRDIPDWLKVNGNKLEVVAQPSYDKDQSIINEQLIIEYYSR
jgi:small subunit ribosomal protein S4